MSKTPGYFGLKSCKYAFPATGGTWGAPVSLPYAQSLSLSTKINTATLDADDRRVIEVPSDNGYDGTLGLSNLDQDYEAALGYSIVLDNGTVAQLDAVALKKHCLYFETTGANEDNSTFLLKTWLVNVSTSKAGKNYTTKGDNVEFGKHEVPISIYGTPLIDAVTGEEFVDENGMTRMVYMVSSVPGDAGYATFGDAVPDLEYTAI